jgi:hypothetical protein
MAEELAKPLPTPTIPPVGKKLGVQDIVGFQQPFLARKSEIQKDITGAEGEEAKAKQAQAETLATGKVGVEKDFGTAEREAMQQYQGKVEKEPLPAFIPTKDTAQDMAQLFSVVNVIGMLIGGGGKQNAQLAMNAMNGMLEGHQKGRQDLYRQERDTFEKNFKSMLQKHAEFRKEMDDAIKLASTDKQAGIAAAELAATKAGSPIVQAQLRKGDLLGAYKLVDESQRGASEALKFVERQQEREATEAAAERRHKQSMAQALELAKIRASGTGGALPKDKETNNEHRFRFTAMENLNDVLRDIQDPKIRKLIGPENQYVPDLFLNLQKNYPELAQKLARFQSEEFKLGGKNLTATEQKILGPIYNWRGLTADALEDNLREASRALNREQMILESRYPGLQEMSERYSGSVGGNVPRTTTQLSQQDQQALDWANTNPNDPRSAQIKQRLGR